MRLIGLGVSAGIGIGKALVLKRGTRDLQFRVPAAQVARELERLCEARERSRAQLQQIRSRIAESVGAEHAYLFDAQLLMLDDAMLIDRAAEIIRTEQLNAASALERALGEISTLFDRAEDAYLRERKGDVGDVVGRLCMNLRGGGDPVELFKALFNDLEGPLVLVADELTPSVIAQLDWQRLAAIVTDAGSWTYHTAILARSIHVPAVAGLHNASSIIQPGALLAVDGATGDVFVDPDEAALDHVLGRQQRRAAYEQTLDGYRRLPPVTEDGVQIRLEANVESPDDAVRARERGADGVGLFRSEFLLAAGGHCGADGSGAVQRLHPPDRQHGSGPGDDSHLRRQRGATPDGAPGTGRRPGRGSDSVACGSASRTTTCSRRSCARCCAPPCTVRCESCFPFVSGVEELRAARAAVERAAAAAASRRGSRAARADRGHDRGPLRGADGRPARRARGLLQHRDQRSHPVPASPSIGPTTGSRGLYEPLHPAIIRMIRLVTRAARRRGIPVSVCGEMAADPVLLTLLVGLGLREFSMAPTAIPLAKQVLRGLHAGNAATMAARTLRAGTAAEIEKALLDFLAPQEIKGI